jgi:hypothetical protein
MKKAYYDELLGIQNYLESPLNEDAKRDWIKPLFRKLFGEKFRCESAAAGADGYVEGKLLIELKSNFDQWFDGFYQGLHYAKLGLSYPILLVITKDFLAFWKVRDIPEFAKKLAGKSDALKSPSEIGPLNAKKSKAFKNEIFNSNFFYINNKEYDKSDIFSKEKSLLVDLYELLSRLNNLEVERIMINDRNFIQKIEHLKKFHNKPIDAIHCFYAMAAYWDVTSKIVDGDVEDSDVQIVSYKDSRASEQIKIKPRDKPEFKKFVEDHYIFTNEGSGLKVDYYFSRFDEVMSILDKEYTKQHGIFFTDANLSAFAQWFVHEYFLTIGSKYIVIDPAGGSGNLVSSWRGNIKHKIVSELQPDLLKIIERRMKADPYQYEDTGFTIIPKTIENKGLNFLDCSSKEYLDELKKILREKSLSFDKPLAFLLNPPYKNTDENIEKRELKDAEYKIHETILELTGKDAGKERYLAFLAQILNIAKEQVKDNENFHPLLMIFTPTSWLIPRTTYIPFREKFDKHFIYEKGFIITGNEFFEIPGRWPLAFTIWSYNYNEEGNKNIVRIRDFTHLKRENLKQINWYETFDNITNNVKKFIENSKLIKLSIDKKYIQESCGQSMYDFKRDPTKTELQSLEIYGGLPIKDERRKNKKTYGISNSEFIGLMDNLSSARIKQDKQKRIVTKNDRVWFRLDAAFADINKTTCVNCPTPVKSYCSEDLKSAFSLFSWFAISKCLNGKYPLWANQNDLWEPTILKEKEKDYYSLCFVFALAENRCVVTKFEKDNPVVGAPEVFVDNPLCPLNNESFWAKTIEPYIVANQSIDSPSMVLNKKIKEFYSYWNMQYCKSTTIFNCGLENEPYFKYFDYPDFLTPYSGLIQIKKYAEINGCADLILKLQDITKMTKAVKDEIYRMLVEDFRYFE